jgi:hypothetical protein
MMADECCTSNILSVWRHAEGSVREPLLSPRRQRPEAAPLLPGPHERDTSLALPLQAEFPSSTVEDVFEMDDASAKQASGKARREPPCSARPPGQHDGETSVQDGPVADPSNASSTGAAGTGGVAMPIEASRDWNDIMEDEVDVQGGKPEATRPQRVQDEKEEALVDVGESTKTGTGATCSRKSAVGRQATGVDLRSLSDAAAAAAAEALEAMESEKAQRATQVTSISSNGLPDASKPHIASARAKDSTASGVEAGSCDQVADAAVQLVRAQNQLDRLHSSGRVRGSGEQHNMQHKKKRIGWPGREALEEAAALEPMESGDTSHSQWLSRVDSGNLRLFPNTPEGHYAEIACVPAFHACLVSFAL